jgi:branched-chain amino acid transport system substrate-binding protein
MSQLHRACAWSRSVPRLAVCVLGALATLPLAAQNEPTPTQNAPMPGQNAPIRIGVATALQSRIGRDTLDSVQMAVAEINAKGGVIGRKLEVVTADEAQDAAAGIEAFETLVDQKVDVVIGGYASGVTLAQLPHIAHAKTLYLEVGAASPAITAPVKDDYDKYKYIFRVSPLNAAHQARGLADFVAGFVMGEMAAERIAIVGEDAKWVQDLLPLLQRGAVAAGADVRLAELFDAQTTDFSPLLSRIKDSGAQFLLVILSQASSEAFVTQWYDARLPMPIGGIDVKSMDVDFFKRVGGKSISEITANLSLRAPITPKTVPYWDAFVKKTGRSGPAYTGPGSYDAVYVYADAVGRAGTTEVDAVIRALEQTDYIGAVGRIQFDDSHDVKAGPGLVGFAFAQWQDKGQRAIVWPEEMRTAPTILPPWLQK